MASPQTSHRVLVIDDDPTLIAVLSDILSMVGGYDVHIARDGASGLESVLTVQPDCVVVDVRMPGLNGFQFVRAVRGRSRDREYPPRDLERHGAGSRRGDRPAVRRGRISV